MFQCEFCANADRQLVLSLLQFNNGLTELQASKDIQARAAVPRLESRLRAGGGVGAAAGTGGGDQSGWPAGETADQRTAGRAEGQGTGGPGGRAGLLPTRLLLQIVIISDLLPGWVEPLTKCVLDRISQIKTGHRY